ncbi:protein canopy 4 [Narcine bancroftii]|uniref:protein canopy 4 n=1 Tax=Narcine bancroftii TaxID=1343680 RepID=UPI003831536F
MLEEYEDVVEDWYFHHQDLELERFLCVTHVLGKGDQDCLTEVWTGRKGDVDAAAGKERRAEEPGEGGEKEGEREEHWAIHNHASEL